MSFKIKSSVYKFISYLLMICIFFLLFPYCTHAASSGAVEYGAVGDSVTAQLSTDGVLTLTGQGGTYDYSEECPAPWSAERARITSIVIGDEITSLGSFLFYDCKNLTGVLRLPESLRCIGSRTFSGDCIENAPKLQYIFNDFTGVTVDDTTYTITEQELGEEIFCPGQTGVLILAGNGNESFRDMALDAGFVETVGWTELSFSNGITTKTVPVPETEMGLFLPAPADSGISLDSGENTAFSGWSQDGEKTYPAYSFQTILDETVPLTAVWQPPRVQQMISQTVDGTLITVSGRLPDNAVLCVKAVPMENAVQMVEERFGMSAPSIQFAYDITILTDGASYQPAEFGSSVIVTIGGAAVTEDFSILHFKSDDTVEMLPVQAEGVDAVFETDSFSLYIGVNKWVKLPGTLWYDGTCFYSDEACSADKIVNDGSGVPFTDLQSVLNHIDGDLTIYMKGVYSVTDAQSVTGGTAYSILLKRYNDTSTTNADYTGNLISIAAGGSLTLSHITIDGGAVWTGTVDSVLDRGTTNSGIASTDPMISVATGGILTTDDGTLLQNSAASDGKRGSAVSCSGRFEMLGGCIRNCWASSGAAISLYRGSAVLSGGLLCSNSCTGNTTLGEGYGGAICSVASTLTIQESILIENNRAHQAGGIFCNVGNCYVTGGTVTANYAPFGGGICGCNGSKLIFSGGRIIENNATTGADVYTLQGSVAVSFSGGTAGSVYLSTSADTGTTKKDSLKITGGSIKNVSGVTPTNDGTTPVYLNTITMSGVTEVTPLTAITDTAYGMTGVTTDADGKLYVWLPESTITTDATVNGANYTGSIVSSSDSAAAAIFTNAAILTAGGSWTSYGSYDTSWYLGHESATAYHITTPLQLAGLSVLVNGDDASNTGYYQTKPNSTEKANDTLLTAAYNMAGKTIYLDHAIALNSGELSESSRPWTPIGSYTDTLNNKPFSGILEGNGHTVSGLYINTSESYQGLFGYISGSGAMVENLTISGSIAGDTNIGSVAGYADGTVQNCANAGSVTGTGSNVGGVTGTVDGTVQNCYSIGSVSGDSSVGGVTGAVGSTGTAQFCYFLKVADGVNASLNAVGTTDTGTLTSLGFFADSGGTLTAANSTTLTYNDTLLTALNGWVAAQSDSSLSTWELVSGENSGYPLLTGNAYISITQAGTVTLYACDETVRAVEQPNAVTLDLALLFGSITALRGKTISVSSCVISDGLTLDAYNTVYTGRRNSGYATANTHFGITSKLGAGTETDMQSITSTTVLGTIAADTVTAPLTLKLYNYNALTVAGSVGTVALTLSDGTNTRNVVINITRAVADLSATVPLNVTAAVTATGDFIFPSGISCTIKNNSAFPIELTQVEWSWTGNDGSDGNTKTGVFALVENARDMTPSLGFESGQETYTFNTGQANSKAQTVTGSQILAHNGILPGELELWWNLRLGSGCSFSDVWDGSQTIATITYTIAAAQNAADSTP